MKKMKAALLLILILSFTTLTSDLTGQVKKKRTTTKQPVKTQTQNQTPFAPTKDSFSIMLPSGFPALKRKVQVLKPSEDLTLTLVTYSAKLRTKKGNKECNIMYMDAPPDTFSAMTDRQILESFQRNSMNDVPNALIIEEEKFIWNQITGERTSTINYSETKNNTSKHLVSGLMTFLSGEDRFGIHYIRMDAFVIKPRIYVISLAYDDENAFEEDSVKNFFDSFRVTKLEK